MAEEQPAKDRTRISRGVVDIAIVGAGPAGMQAAIEGAIDGFNTTFIDADITVAEGSKFSSQFTEVIPVFFKGSPREFASNAFATAVAWGAKPYLGVKAMSLAYDAQTGIKTLVLSDGEKIQALAVVIGTGASNTEWLPPEIERVNGRVAAERNLETRIPGVFAAGDILNGSSIPSISAAVGDGTRAEAHAVQFIAALMARNNKPYFRDWMKDTSDWSDTRLAAVKHYCPRCLEYSQSGTLQPVRVQ
jgi:thioredoxin reductase